jgi:hypothetical protein
MLGHKNKEIVKKIKYDKKLTKTIDFELMKYYY